jgi:hypothetical protein
MTPLHSSQIQVISIDSHPGWTPRPSSRPNLSRCRRIPQPLHCPARNRLAISSPEAKQYLDFRDVESPLPLVAVLVGRLQDTIWELIYGLVPDRPRSIRAPAHLNGLKYTAPRKVIVGLGPCMQDVRVHTLLFRPPSADIH